MLTLPMTVALGLGASASFAGFLFYTFKGEWVRSFVTYLLTGFFLIAVPFKIVLTTTSWVGMLFLSVSWPLWLMQEPLHYKVSSWMPLWLTQHMFNF